jgi:hypothetical protein
LPRAKKVDLHTPRSVLFLGYVSDSLAPYEHRSATTKQHSRAGAERSRSLWLSGAASLQRAYVCSDILRAGGKVLPGVQNSPGGGVLWLGYERHFFLALCGDSPGAGVFQVAQEMGVSGGYRWGGYSVHMVGDLRGLFDSDGH